MLCMNRIDKYISIEEIKLDSPGAKTKKWEVRDKDSIRIGEIKWYGGWRKYVYYNDDAGFSDWDFLRLVADFCETKTKEHYGL